MFSFLSAFPSSMKEVSDEKRWNSKLCWHIGTYEDPVQPCNYLSLLWTTSWPAAKYKRSAKTNCKWKTLIKAFINNNNNIYVDIFSLARLKSNKCAAFYIFRNISNKNHTLINDFIKLYVHSLWCMMLERQEKPMNIPKVPSMGRTLDNSNKIANKSKTYF